MKQRVRDKKTGTVCENQMSPQAYVFSLRPRLVAVSGKAMGASVESFETKGPGAKLGALEFSVCPVGFGFTLVQYGLTMPAFLSLG